MQWCHFVAAVPQVLSKALQVWSITVIPLDSPDVKDAKAEPQNEQAFICNLQVHQAARLPAHIAACGSA